MSKPMSDEQIRQDLQLFAGDEPTEAPRSYLRQLLEEIQHWRANHKAVVNLKRKKDEMYDELWEKHKKLTQENEEYFAALMEQKGWTIDDERVMTVLRGAERLRMDLKRARGLLKKLVDIEKSYVSDKPLISCQGQAMSGFDALENFRAVAQEAMKGDP